MLYVMESEITAPAFERPTVARTEQPEIRARDKDPLLERLVRSLLPPEQAREVLRGYYTDALHARLQERVEVYRCGPVTDDGPRKVLPLQQWRHRRVAAFVNRNLDQPITLACLAREAGLSRMHFAASFRRATGMRPHDYVIQRRIECAKQLLSDLRTPIVEVALSVGFQSQSQFTTVFKRAVGMPPHRWRLMLEAKDLAA
jgi:AraC-like DNA-binding protein